MENTKAMKQENTIFDRLQAGEWVSFDDPQYKQIAVLGAKTMKLTAELNASADVNHIRNLMSKITGVTIDESTRIFPPIYINIGKFTRIGKNVFINSDCSFLDMGKITIEDDVLIGPKVSLLTEHHPLEPANRRKLGAKPIHIERNVWIGAGATILPGVTIGENSVVAAGAVVSKDVPANCVVGGIPANVLKTIE